MSELGGVTSDRFSTDDVPERDRVGLWREFFGRMIVGLDMEPTDEEPLRFEMTNRRLNRLAVATGRFSGYSASRTPELLNDNRADLSFFMPGRSVFYARQRGREAVVREGQAVLMNMGETGRVEQPAAAISTTQYLHVNLPREALAPLVPDLDDAALTVVPADNEALRLLRSYAGMLNGSDELVTAHTAHAVATHILDLAVLAIGGSREARAVARTRGLGAARLASIKAYVRARAGDPGLTVADAARYAGISPGYVWKLFVAEGDGFSSYLLEQRLERARRMLEDPVFAQFRISAIAYRAGFGDLSYFNRTFRRRFGATPSDVRARALEEGS